MGATAKNQWNEGSWVEGVFVEPKPGILILRTASEEISVEPGMDLEAKVSEKTTYQGVTARRDDCLYFLGRRPMFALPITLLNGRSGRVQIKK